MNSRVVTGVLATGAVAAAVVVGAIRSFDGIEELGLTAWVVSASILATVIEWRVPGKRMSRILLGTGVVGSIAALSDALMAPDTAVVLSRSEAVWEGLGTLSFFSFFWVSLGLMPLLFPTGTALSPRWAWFGWLGVGAIVLVAPLSIFPAEYCLVAGSDGCEAFVDNPHGISWMPSLEHSSTGGLLFATLGVSLLGGVISMVVRFVRSTGLERQQLKWPLTAILIIVLWLLGTDIVWVGLLGQEAPPELVAGIILAISWASIPTAIGLAVLRYRLYEIDRVISRTVSYAVVVGLLAGVFAAGVVGLPRLLNQGDSPVFVAVSTLAVASLFNPVRKKVQAKVDQRFNRSRYDAERVMGAFTTSLRDRIDTDAVTADWVAAVAETMQPASIGVWTKSS